MLDSFKAFFKKPEFPDSKPDLPLPGESGKIYEDTEDYAENDGYIENTETETLDEEDEEFPADDSSSRQEKNSGAWVRTAAGVAACIGGVCMGIYWFILSDAPRPAEIPQGDILASLAAAPTAAPPNSAPAPSPPEAAPTPPSPDSPKPAKPATVPNPPEASVPEPAPAKQDRQTPTTEAPVKKTTSGAFGANPFIDLSLLHTAEASTASGLGLPTIYGSGNMALPEVPRPAVSPDLLPSPGEIRTPAAPVGAASAPPSMGGVITKPNGESIAIMGDGTVLSEGDTYKGDRRVTFIGGDGITFDDGNTVPFGQNN